jgi:hypothetical protein
MPRHLPGPTFGPTALALLALAASFGVDRANAAAAPSPAGCVSNAVVTSDADDDTGTLRSAVAGLCDGGTITFADRIVLELSSEIVVDKQVAIDGSSVAGDATAGGDALVQISGRTDVRSFRVTADGDLTLRRLRVSNGGLDDLGGGIRSAGRLAVFDSRFDHNVGGTINGLGGGAIYSALDSVLVVDGSTFDANDAQRGSAIFNSGSAQISTFSGNGPTLQREGAIENRGTLVAAHLTISGNGNNGGFGGVFAFNADTTFANTIIAGNTGTECAISGGTVSSIALLAPAGSCQPTLSDDPQLASLAANGGPTMTHALTEGSPAMDAGDSGFCPPIDQRGIERPNGSGCDLGAFEIEQERLFQDGFDGLPPPEAVPSNR